MLDSHATHPHFTFSLLVPGIIFRLAHTLSKHRKSQLTSTSPWCTVITWIQTLPLSEFCSVFNGKGKETLEQESYWRATAHVRTCRGTDLACFSLPFCLSTKKPLLKLKKLENIPASFQNAPRSVTRYHWHQ